MQPHLGPERRESVFCMKTLGATSADSLWTIFREAVKGQIMHSLGNLP